MNPLSPVCVSDPPTMPVDQSVDNPDGAEFRNLRIHKWITAVQSSDVPQLQRSSSNTGSIARADSPLLGFTSQENASHDPLYRPSPDYVRRLPEELRSSAKSTSHDKVCYSTRIYAHILRDIAHIVILNPVSRGKDTAYGTRRPGTGCFTS